MLKYRERGIISRLKKVWLTQEKTAKADDEQVRQISYEHIHGVLIAYLVCLAFSCFILFLEFLLFYFDKFHTLFIKMTK